MMFESLKLDKWENEWMDEWMNDLFENINYKRGGLKEQKDKRN